MNGLRCALGRCMLTVGTGRDIPEESLLPLKLLPAHCYAVTGESDNVASAVFRGQLTSS